ncbi:MAG: glycosyl transferase family 90 [Planctomycetota bacterium]|nr:glycosyl transferase family 90 [Planctomycetota bacterium]
MGHHSLHNLRYYVERFSEWPIPAVLFRRRLQGLLRKVDEHPERDRLRSRADYYIQCDEPFEVCGGTRIGNFQDWVHSSYYFDIRRVLRYFPAHLGFEYRFGDETDPPERPTLTKARLIGEGGRRSVILKLNQVRHYRFVNDRVPYEAKEDRLVWRGNVTRPWRAEVVRRYHADPSCDVGRTNHPEGPEQGYKPRLSISEQLRHKFILCVEGNDVATGLKWVMSSNSLCFMARPRFETWFLEGRLEPGRHFVEVAADHSDLLERVEEYRARPEEAMEIVRNANEHVRQFRDRRSETLVSLLVLARYFELSGQL